MQNRYYLENLNEYEDLLRWYRGRVKEAKVDGVVSMSSFV